ncbi:MAG: hypothetical protein AB7N71_03000 [Phycisphaerae bacterium]
MLYAALTFWLLIIMFGAWGVHAIWSQMTKPKIVNSILLPGTLVAQLGHIFGLLITGNRVQNASLMGDDEQGDPSADPPEKPRIPVIGPIVIGLLPLVACGACLYIAARSLGRPLVWNLAVERIDVARTLPTSLAGVWALLRDAIALAEDMLTGILQTELLDVANIVFLYLAVCLTVRMAPFAGNRRGAIGAVLLAGLLITVVSLLLRNSDDWIHRGWPLLTFSVGMVLLLLIFSLVVRGLVGLVKILARGN